MKNYGEDPKLFFEDCGSEFVSSYTPGAYALGLIEFSTTSSESKKKADEQLKKLEGSVSDVISFSGKFQRGLEVIEKETNSTCHIYCIADGGTGTISLEKDKFLPSLFSYIIGSDPKNSIIYSINTTPYYRLIPLDNDSERRNHNLTRSLSEFINSKAFDIDNYKTRIKLRISNIEILENILATEDCSGSRRDEIHKTIGSLRIEIFNIEKMANKCAADPFRSWTTRCGQQ
ncbi:hypothetical protein [Desulfovibrio sp. DV]|uniref:hypothetical protein n=1 Tax=Desulfovibrio sp. DV TaxID=1844708 RepID=UPI000A7596B7|nr:hypothetical protein [Desulfovibrio sp. DV]